MEGALPAVRAYRLPLWRIANLLALGGVIFVAAGIALAGYKGDAYIYWQASHLPADMYRGTWNVDPAYVYPPVMAQVISPLGLLPYPLFLALWVALETAALVWLAGPLLAFAAILLYEPFQHEILTGNVNLVLAAAVVLAVRYPAWWAFPLLSKVTPGVGLLYHALRREWRPVGIAVGVAAIVATASFLAAPTLWADWVSWTVTNSSGGNPDELLPFGIRFAAAIAVVGVGAWKGWRWTMVLAAGLAMPNFVPMNLAYFVALVPFLFDPQRSRAAREASAQAAASRPLRRNGDAPTPHGDVTEPARTAAAIKADAPEVA